MECAARVALWAMGPVALFFAISACGSGSDDAGGRGNHDFRPVSDTGVLFTPEDLAAVGYKTSKEYGVDGLPGATAAIFGFWRPTGGDPIDYEIRFYPSHAEAVDLGTASAEEGSGKDAVLNAERATYKEGVTDRRSVIGQTPSGAGPKYADYAIFNNIVMLCAGADSGQSIERCGLLALALE